LDMFQAGSHALYRRGALDGRTYAFDFKLLQERTAAATDVSLWHSSASC
jgi:hypothetical protein